ncbi:AAEL000385-PA [Aedes aegypti]|uniref:AAEL000385-PA n=2 Tax=Aedes aegypti TaxID=7159 RepID=Q0IGF3_AEDAE|nr:RNA-binding protein 45 [Aedes aegypti]XP_001656065.1 RNA-binding protein 45 [Aedes aegypti]EAT48584.1 AAEL000385-PB [Aedes aegypti]EAT48585.1 AAEL000385-PA [Aedes aegypti]
MQEHMGRREISEEPPMSRLFVICGRQVTKEQLMKHFADDGEIEECIVIVDKKTGQGKGVAYVKFTKTSSAARGLRKNGSYIENETRPIKVMISASYQKKKEDGTPEEVNEYKFRRLFAVIPISKDEEAIKSEFSRFGTVIQVRLVPDKKNQSQCAAYITFTSFLETALAIEGCDPNYRAKFCLPREALNKEKEASSSGKHESSNGSSRKRTHSPESGRPGGDVKLVVICSNSLNQDRLWRIFDIAPGMKYCNIVTQNDINITASVVYSSKSEAQRAVDKIHGLEYPIGERIIVRYEDEFRDEISSNDVLSQLGPPKPILNPQTTQCAKKAFFICMPEAVSVKLLQDAFCRFGDLINVYLIPGKRHGYAAFASDVSADRAIQQLHGIQLGDCRLKVLECMEQNDNKKRRQTDQ